jgi:hypothetical protein
MATLDLFAEECLSLAQAARKLPTLRGARIAGKGVHPVTLWRWTKIGLNSPDGQKIRLETVRIGGTNCTSLEALQRFLDRLQGEEVPPTTNQPRALAKKAATAMEELRDLGYCE